MCHGRPCVILRQISAWGKPAQAAEPVAEPILPEERCLTLLMEGAALNTPEVDVEAYRAFRNNLSRLALQIPDRLPDQDKIVLMRTIVHEFETYGHASETALKERLAAWRALTARLLRELFGAMGVDSTTTAAKPLVENARRLLTADDIRNCQEALDNFLRPRREEETRRSLSGKLDAADLSTSNTNATGLPGGGAALDQLRHELERGSSGFIVRVRFSCLEMIHQRFGMPAVEDCLMAVAAHFTSQLNSEDRVYHWSDSSLVAILLNRYIEENLVAELERIASRNRDVSITVGDRTIVLRVPLLFDIFPLIRFKQAEDLYRFTQSTGKKR
jgi:GGDEF domain-containing protein